jgi:mono/diheme cytochrome c family protein
MNPTNPGLATAAFAALALAATTVAADGRVKDAVPLLPRYQQECGSCHVAYPPGLLPALSWQRLVGGLSHHFGADASVEAAVAAELDAWLTEHAAKLPFAGGPPPEDRITRSPWFVREHREVPAKAWKRAAISGPGNCAACHRDAARGRFDEESVSLPQ